MKRLAATRFQITRTALAGLALLSVGAPMVSAQGDGFLLGVPRVTMTFMAGYVQPRAASGGDAQSLWDLTREELTVDTRDLGGTSLGGQLGIRVSERFDLTVAFSYNYSETRSEFRDWVDQDELPIEQTTRFVTAPVTVGLKAYLLDRGRSFGRYAFVPRTWNPYLGLAGGLVYYRFQQHGDFVDFETLDIFNDNFLSQARAPTVHFLGGVDVAVNQRLLLVGEGRYALGTAPLDSDFVGFPDLDLAGFQFNLGLSLRY
ncbi:MAG: hypothetical protein F4187_00425 [Gemmatimonadetes bacterium]|nr:hypothetical protein [Gemmatimonadota bacterium]